MDSLELAKVQAFYYSKLVEFGGDYVKARNSLEQYHNNKWVDFLPDPYDIDWSNTGELRIKPQTVRHPGGEMPLPLSVDEATNANYVYVPMMHSQGVSCHKYSHLTLKQKFALIGHAYATEQDAINAAHIIFNIPKSWLL